MTRQDISDFTLEQYLLNELSPVRRAEVERRLREDSSLQSKVEALRRSNEEILQRYPAAQFIAKLAAQKQRSTPIRVGAPQNYRWSVFNQGLVAVFSIVMVLAMGIVLRELIEAPQVDDGVRLKGLEPSLILYRRNAQGVVQLAANDHAAAGDQLQVQYQAAGFAYGVIFSIDGRGALTVHYPQQRQVSGALQGGGIVSLDFAYQLDEAPHFERFFFIVSADSFSLDTILAQAQQLAQDPAMARVTELDIPANWRQWSMVVVKE